VPNHHPATLQTVGMASASFSGATISAIVIGLVQIIGGLAGSKIFKLSLRLKPQHLIGSLLLGGITGLTAILSVATFTCPGADVGVSTFLITMSVVPGAFVDSFVFRDRLNQRQWGGVAVFLLAGYAMLNFPNLQGLLHLELWVWLSLGVALMAVASETTSKWIREINPLVNNFYGGISAVVICTLILIGAKGWGLINQLTPRFWLGTIAIGGIAIVIISLKTTTYNRGARIALKKVMMQGTLLTATNILGAVIYGEAITIGKVVGILGFFIAFSLRDQGTWLVIKNLLARKRIA